MTVNEVLIGLVVMLGAGLWGFKRLADKNKTDAILGETRGRDKELSAQQKQVQDKIEDVKKQDDSKLTPEERAKRWD